MEKIFESSNVLQADKIYFGMYYKTRTKQIFTEDGMSEIQFNLTRFGILYEIVDGIYIDIIDEKIVKREQIDSIRFNKFDELLEKTPEEISVGNILKLVNVLLKSDYIENINPVDSVELEKNGDYSNNMYTRFLNNVENTVNKKLK